MDINYHYFTVKTLAREAGFNEAEAQRIATFSQFIDDFNWITYIDCKNIPSYIKDDPNYDLYISAWVTANLNFNPAVTGFKGIVDMTSLLLERTQKFTVSPFHFIPRDLTNDVKAKRVVPATIGDGSIISRVLEDARRFFINQTEPRSNSLLRIGMLLHTFADTYAHQMFSGYDSWVNDVTDVTAVNNITQADITQDIRNEIKMEAERIKAAKDSATESNAILPCIGHMWAGHSPDLTNISFSMRYKQNRGDTQRHVYQRSNTDTFLIASRHTLNYLRACLGRRDISDADWATLSANIRRGFMIEFPKRDVEATLARHWAGFFLRIPMLMMQRLLKTLFMLTRMISKTPTTQTACLELTTVTIFIGLII